MQTDKQTQDVENVTVVSMALMSPFHILHYSSLTSECELLNQKFMPKAYPTQGLSYTIISCIDQCACLCSTHESCGGGRQVYFSI